ncbi:helix-turn-helix domain-containing protein [Novosphingobium guangzhouense]|uniref:helix-turn-helix domain-containing protein n=1 Tax=Novosphingobium guangzhouense TaxID=1850347 RepID=UPI003CCC0517
MPPPLMTEGEAAKWLAICSRTLRALRQEGKITYVQMKSGIRYTLDDLQAFVESQRTCRSTAAKAPRTSGCRSRSPAVLDFEAVRAKRTRGKRG